MENFNVHQTTQIRIGRGRVQEFGQMYIQLAPQSMVLPDFMANQGVATEQEMIELIRHFYSYEYET